MRLYDTIDISPDNMDRLICCDDDVITRNQAEYWVVGIGDRLFKAVQCNSVNFPLFLRRRIIAWHESGGTGDKQHGGAAFC